MKLPFINFFNDVLILKVFLALNVFFSLSKWRPKEVFVIFIYIKIY